MAGRDPGPVEDQHHERFALRRDRARLEPATLVELAAAEQPFQLVPLVADQPLGARRVVLLRVLGVRQPLDVVPVAQPVPAGADRDPQVLVRVERGQLRDDRPGGRPGEVDRTLQQDPREPAQVHRDRHVLDQAVRAQEPAQRAGAQRFEVGHRLGLRCLYLQRQPLLPESDTHLAEVGVVGATFPQPLRRHHGPQPARIGVGEQHRGALPVDTAADLLAGLTEIAQIVAALGAQLELAVRAAAHHHRAAHDPDGDEHDAAGHEQHRRVPGATVARLDVEHHHRHGGDHHGQVHEHAVHAPAHVLRQYRRLLQRELSLVDRRCGLAGLP